MDAKKFFYMESQEGGCNLPQKSYAEVASAFNYKLLSAIAATDGGEKDNIFVSPCRLQALLVLLSNSIISKKRRSIIRSSFFDVLTALHTM